MGFLRKLFGHAEKETREIEAARDELKRARSDLRVTVNGLGQEVWSMVETGDPLGALVHGARHAHFHRDIKRQEEEGE